MEANRAVELMKNLIITSIYWYVTGFCCNKREGAAKVTGLAAWFFAAACVFLLSSRNLMPEFLNVCDGVGQLFNVVAVIFIIHITFCYVWVELLTALSLVFCYIDDTAKNAGFPILTDNILITLEPNCGYFNLFTVLAFGLWIYAIVTWMNAYECEDPSWCSAECSSSHSACAARRALSACFGDRSPSESSLDGSRESLGWRSGDQSCDSELHFPME